MIEPCKMINGIDLKFLSLNVRGINNFIKRQKLFTWFKKSKANIIFIQETYSSEENKNNGLMNGVGTLHMVLNIVKVQLF